MILEGFLIYLDENGKALQTRDVCACSAMHFNQCNTRIHGNINTLRTHISLTCTYMSIDVYFAKFILRVMLVINITGDHRDYTTCLVGRIRPTGHLTTYNIFLKDRCLDR